MPEIAAGPPLRVDAPARARVGPPAFDRPVPAGGYQWWYLDALDPTGERGVVVIAFVGSVFSPYYHLARGRGRPDAENYCAVNVGLYRPSGKAWCMTERRRGSITREATQFRVGPSSLRWEAGELVVDLCERCMPFGQRLRGQVRARPVLTSALDLELDGVGRHRWTPWAPLARVQVELTEPGVSWQGSGYLDSNRGDEPLEAAFASWNWSRVEDSGVVDVHYELSGRDGSQKQLAMRFDANGHSQIPKGRRFDLPGSLWGVPRRARADAPARLARTLEDTPFYARSLLAVDRAGGPALGVHEALSLQRFRRSWVRAMLPFRMPREWPASGS